MRSPRQAARMAAKERRTLRRARRVIAAHYAGCRFPLQLPPGAPTAVHRERGCISYTWEPWSGATAITLRAAPGRRYTVTSERRGIDLAIWSFGAASEGAAAAARELGARFALIGRRDA